MAPIRPCATGRRGEAGFTLTELLVVLAIIGLLVAAIPVLLRSAIPGTQALAAARSLANDLRLARGLAIARGATISVTFDPARQVYAVAPGGDVHVLPNHIRFALAQRGTAIGFYPDGSSNGGAVFVGDGGTRHRVAADWLTGRISIDE
jgi:general secretion pathway protein H